jgi:hypothetical protein
VKSEINSWGMKQMKKCKRRCNYQQTEDYKSKVKEILDMCVVYPVREVFSVP